jgi:hypothetical protein
MTIEHYYYLLESGIRSLINIVTVISQYCKIISVISKSLKI